MDKIDVCKGKTKEERIKIYEQRIKEHESELTKLRNELWLTIMEREDKDE